MKHSDIKKKIIQLLTERGPLPEPADPFNIEDFDYNYIDAGHIDSISIINFIFKLEATFSITIDPIDTHTQGFRTLNGLSQYIFQKTQA